MKKLCVLSALSLTACGGGGGSSPTTTASVTTPPSAVAPQEVTYFSEIKNAIPSLSLYYNKTCNTEANSFMIPTVDANKDGRKDLFIVLWCPAPFSTFDGPVKNTVIGLLQNNDGTFRLGNQEIFGREFVEITGSMGEGGDVGIGDFNGDGKEDIAFTPSLEDGRQFVIYPTGGHNWQTTMTVFLSKADGSYSIDKVGNVATYESIAIIKGKDRDMFHSGGRIWSYENNTWNSVTISYKIDRTAVFFDNKVAVSINDGKVIGWQVGSVQNNYTTFTRNEYLHLSDLQTVKVYNDTIKGDTSESLATIDGIDYLMPAFNSICVIPGTTSSEFTIMAEFQGIKIPEKYTGQKLEWTVPGKNGNVTWDNNVTRVLAYKVSDGKISKLNVPEFNKDITLTHYFKCVDMNADKRTDLVVYRWGHKQEKSVIFLSTQNGFTEVPSSKIPNISTIYHGHSVLASDLDNDGKTEIIYGPGTGYKKDYAGLYDDYQVFRAVNPL
jgi:hypothetical protein